MASRAMVVDRHNGIVVALGKRADNIADTFLHLGVGTLNGIQLDGIAILSCLNR